MSDEPKGVDPQEEPKENDMPDDLRETLERVDRVLEEAKGLSSRARILFERWEREKELKSGGQYEREL